MGVVKLRDEFIKLGQALKAAGLVESGAEAKEVITDGLVQVNGEDGNYMQEISSLLMEKK